jgi:hypothetical protein
VISVEPDGNSLYRVIDSDGVVLHEGLSNREAWREAERLGDEPRQIERARPLPKRKARKANRKKKHHRKLSGNDRYGQSEKHQFSNGAAGPCKRICPQTGAVIEIIKRGKT